MADSVVESRGIPVNELGEAVIHPGSGTTNIVGTLATGYIPIDSETGAFVIKLPEATVQGDMMLEVFDPDNDGKIAYEQTEGVQSSLDFGDILGIPNQVVVNGGDNALQSIIGANITLSLPQDIDTGANPLFNSINLENDPTDGAIAVGQMRWSPTYGVPEIGLQDGVTGQLFLESYVPVHNDSLVTIPNGRFVYIDGTIASASDMRAGETIAMTTQDILPGTTGFATYSGAVNDIDVSHLTQHSLAWLAEDGLTTNVKPEYPLTAVEVGYAHNATTFDVRIQSLAYQKGFDILQQPLGVYDRTQSTLSYDYSTRTASIAKVGAYWAYFRKGIEYRQVTTVSLTHAATTGSWFFYIDATGTFVITQTPWNLLNCCPLMYIYYSAISASSSLALEERHGATRNPEWHRGQHNTIGTYYQTGFVLSGYTLYGTTDANNKFALTEGIVSDEDIQNTINAITTAAPYNVMYRSGATGEWIATTNTVPYTAGTYIQYNQNTGSTWQLTDLTSSEFMNLYVVAVPSIHTNKQIIVIPSQAKYATQALAEAAKIADDIMWGTLATEFGPFSEFCIAHRLTMRTGSSYTTTGKVRIEAYKDLRGKSTRIQIVSGVV